MAAPPECELEELLHTSKSGRRARWFAPAAVVVFLGAAACCFFVVHREVDSRVADKTGLRNMERKWKVNPAVHYEVNFWGDIHCVDSAISTEPPPGTPQLSKGCQLPVEERSCSDVEGLTEYTVEVEDAGLGKTVKRKFLLEVTKEACRATKEVPAPLSLWFHGQYGESLEEANDFGVQSGYRSCSRRNNYFTIYPQGIGFDEDREVTGEVLNLNGWRSTDLGTGWNTNDAGDENTCVTQDDLWGALRRAGKAEYSCYSSCMKQNKCGRCNWSTCFDDIAFVKAMLSKVSNEFCIDMSRLFAGGQSNGGMMTHRLTQALPGIFAGFNPIYGLPLLGKDLGTNGQLLRKNDQLQESTIVEFHGTLDKTIPMSGGLAAFDDWTWYYETLEHMMAVWAAINKCDEEVTDITEHVRKLCPDMRPTAKCFEHKACTTKRRVVYCSYEGRHGNIPHHGLFGCLSFHVFNQQRRTSPVTLE